jgi:hypothetical protein
MAPARGYKWNNKREESFLVLLRDAITNGQRVENGWKPEFWTDCITAFRETFELSEFAFYPLHGGHLVQP